MRIMGRAHVLVTTTTILLSLLSTAKGTNVSGSEDTTAEAAHEEEVGGDSYLMNDDQTGVDGERSCVGSTESAIDGSAGSLSCPSPPLHDGDDETNRGRTGKDKSNRYGVDISWPIHHRKVSTNFLWLPHNVDPDHNEVPEEFATMKLQPLGDRQTMYDKFMDGCRQYYGERGAMCDETENERVAMNLRQPKQMQNYTELGFKKIRAPEHAFKIIRDFWDTNKNLGTDEKWPVGYTYVNNWDNEATMLSVENTKIPGGGQKLKNKIWNAARETISEWTGNDLVTSSLYGIRVYKEGAILAPHVDRIPLISSAIINVDQDVDEPWPLEVYGHDGRTYNVTMEPGDMVLYESHSVVHGRPFPLKGRFYANIFIHFEPRKPEQTSDVDAVTAARAGDVDTLKFIAENDREALFRRDENGWQPLHEACREGTVESVEFLLDEGADINAPTNGDATPLFWTLDHHDEDHPLVKFLVERGAVKNPQ